MYLLLCLLLLIPASPGLAQGTLAYGGAVVGTLSPQAPLGYFTFSGTAGDLVTIRVVAITPGLDPNVSLNAPTQQQLANNDTDPLVPGVTDARIDYRLTTTGIHVILVGLTSGSGDFLLRLDGRPGAETPALTDPLADVPLDAVAQVYSFAASPEAAQVLNVTTTTPDFSFRAVIRSATGQVLALLVGNAASPVSFNVPAGTEQYEAEIAATNPPTAGTVNISLTALGAVALPPAPTGDIPPPAATPEVTGDTCIVSSPDGSNRNIRSGPGTNYSIVAQLQAGQPLTAIGINSGWYLLEVPVVGQGWVSADVVAASGNCAALPTVNAPGAPPPAATATQGGPQLATATYTPTTAQGQPPVEATPTYTPTTVQDQVQPTATYTATVQVQDQPTATYTPTYTATAPVPVAPEDARFNSPLNIALDSTASTTDFVSYPDGDREDRVRWDITGMNQSSSLSGGRARLIITASCFGTGTNQVQFSTGGQTYSCGQTIVDREVTSDSRTGSVIITAVGGQGTYVQWVLTGTATRVN